MTHRRRAAIRHDGAADHRERRFGRQAEAERNDRLLLDAAREVFAAQGAGAPVADVARRAGVGIGSLYRRYGSKDELLQRLCLLSMEQTIAAAQGALDRNTDAWTALTDCVYMCVALRSGALSPLAGTVPVTDEMIAASRTAQDLLRALVERAQAAGSVRSDVNSIDVARLIELFSRSSASSAGDDEQVQRRLLALALDGLRATTADPLPGDPPTAASYAARWTRPSGSGVG
jgi:AcrR family transcriptional regulator